MTGVEHKKLEALARHAKSLAKRSTTIWGCPIASESGNEKPFYFVMCRSLRRFIV